MGKHVMMVFTNPADGRDHDFEVWYRTHMREVVENYPGTVSGQHFRLSDAQRAEQDLPWKYLAIYEVESDDLAEFHRQAAEAPRAHPELFTPPGDVVDRSHALWTYTPIGERVVRGRPETG